MIRSTRSMAAKTDWTPRSIITLGAANMPRDAYLVLEIGYDQKVAVSALLEAAGFSQILHRQDLGGNDRAIAATKT